jgi:hypothetical protein
MFKPELVTECEDLKQRNEKLSQDKIQLAYAIRSLLDMITNNELHGSQIDFACDTLQKYEND